MLCDEFTCINPFAGLWHPMIGGRGFKLDEAIVVTLPLLLAALMRRFAAFGVLLAISFMGVATAIEWPLFNLVGGFGPSRGIFVATNIGSAAFILASALIVRLNGYCLYTGSIDTQRPMVL